MSESEKYLIIRFSTRRAGSRRKSVEIAHFYTATGVKVFQARCEPEVISSFLERIGWNVKRSSSGKTMYLEGAQAEDLFRKLVILAGCRQCSRVSSKILSIADAIVDLGEIETFFWYNKMVEEYERKGFWGVCRVAKAFKVLYRID